MGDHRDGPEPTASERQAAACRAMASAPGLIRFAARYTRSLPDAEDAYQRAMEIALRRAPVTEERRFMAWLHTVLRNEALAVVRGRRREGPGVEADVALIAAEAPADDVPPEATVEWRERYGAIQDALGGLTEAQRVCLMLQSAGASYETICAITGYSRRKVERSVLEGRAALHAWEIRLTEGVVCERLDPLIARVAAGEATATERRRVARHVRHCGPCRALLRSRRESNDWLAALVPLALFAGEVVRAGPPDPSPLLAYWDRVATGASVRADAFMQTLIELPGSVLAKVGAGTAAIAVAGAAGLPMVGDAVRAGQDEPAVMILGRAASTTSPTAVAVEAAAARASERAEAAQALRASRQTVRLVEVARAATRERDLRRISRRPKVRPAVVVHPPDPDPARPSTPPSVRSVPPPAPDPVVIAPVIPSPPPVPPSAPAPSRADVALEFGP